MSAVTAVWPDGSTTTAGSYRALEDEIRAAQWTPFRTRAAFRRAMRQRATVWSGNPPRRAFGSSRQFLESLAAAGLFLLAPDSDLQKETDQ